MQMISPQKLSEACKAIGSEKETDKGFCGMFALAILHALGEGSIVAAMRSMAGGELYDPIHHCAYKDAKGRLFDGKGRISKKRLLSRATQDEMCLGYTAGHAVLFDLWEGPDAITHIYENTTAGVFNEGGPEIFYPLILKHLAPLDPNIKPRIEAKMAEIIP